MQFTDSDEPVVTEEDPSKEVEKSEKSQVLETKLSGDDADCGSVLDVSGKSSDFSVPNGSEGSVEGLYMNLVELECLQLKIASPSLTGLPLNKLMALKELELCKVPPRPSAFPLLSEIAGLKCLTKLSVCHFSFRYLPPEIGCLKKLEYLYLSFNKMRSLPTEITYLNALISLKVTNNKLVELPSGLSSLQRLETLDLSNNRLSSLGCLELDSMHNLQKLNLQIFPI
ncbi:hypothetical protein ACSBR2_037809 [Camellia fascicularis]